MSDPPAPQSRTALPPGDAIVLDLDGVVWRGDRTIRGAPGAIERLRGAAKRVVFVTNQSYHPAVAVAEKLRRHGVEATADDVITSSAAAAHLLASRLPAGARVFVAGGPGIRAALAARGLEAVSEGPAAAVVVGWHPTFDFDVLTRAMTLVRGGAYLVATNRDPTYPGPDGLLAGGGSIAAAVAYASESEPDWAGKPDAPIAELVRSRAGSEGVVIGDQPRTDGALAIQLGWPFALVLSGVTEAVPDPAPEFWAGDLAALVDRWVARAG